MSCGLIKVHLLVTSLPVHELVKYVKPVSIVVTGDLTDAKTKDMSGSGQYVEEWEEYQSIIRY